MPKGARPPKWVPPKLFIPPIAVPEEVRLRLAVMAGKQNDTLSSFVRKKLIAIAMEGEVTSVT